MNIDALKNCLKKWIAVDTWHTSHPCDEKRFNQSLNDAFEQLGCPIHADDLERAISELVEELHPNFDKKYRETLISEFVQKAEHISTYLSDVK